MQSHAVSLGVVFFVPFSLFPLLSSSFRIEPTVSLSLFFSLPPRYSPLFPSLCRLPGSVMPPFCSLAREDTSPIFCEQASLHLPACLPPTCLPTALPRTPEPASPFPFSRCLPPVRRIPYNSGLYDHRSWIIGSRKYRGSNPLHFRYACFVIIQDPSPSYVRDRTLLTFLS